MEKIEIFDNERLQEKKLQVRYVILECQECKNSWGIFLNGRTELTEKELTCKTCFFNGFGK